MKQTTTLFRLFGVEYRINWTFFLFPIILLLLVTNSSNEATNDQVIFMLVIVTSLFLHELGHAWIGRLVGFPPNAITLSIFGATATFERLPESSGKRVWMHLGGLIVSFVLLILSIFALYAFGYIDFSAVKFDSISSDKNVSIEETILSFLVVVNAFVFLINLIPAQMYDLGKALHCILESRLEEEKVYNIMARISMVVALLLAGLGYYLDMSFFYILAFLIFMQSRVKVKVNRGVKSLEEVENPWSEEYAAKHDDAPLMDILHTEPVTLYANEFVKSAVDFVKESNAPAFIVIDSTKTPIGFVRKEVLADEKNADFRMETLVEQLPGNEGNLTFTPVDMLQLMENKKLPILPVFNGSKLIGVIYYSELKTLLNPGE